METNKKIQELMMMMDSWGMLEDLSKNDVLRIENELKFIASNAILEAQRKATEALNEARRVVEITPANN